MLSAVGCAGVQEAAHAAFVLVAGGLGERLGFSGIKVALPVDSARGACFLQVRPRPGIARPVSCFGPSWHQRIVVA